MASAIPIGQARTSDTAVGRWRRSWWIALTIAPFGVTSWIAFLYAGLEARSRRWQTWGGIYLAAAAVGLTLMMVPPHEGARGAIGLLLAVAAWLGSIVHALVIRKAYLEATDGLSIPRPDADGDIVLDWSPGKLFLVLAFCALGTLVGVSILIGGSGNRVMALLSVLCAGGGGTVLARRAAKGGGRLFVGPKGLGTADWRIPWSEIVSIDHFEQTLRSSTQHYLNVQIREGYDFPPARKPLYQLLKPINDSIAGGPVAATIALNLLRASPDEVFAVIERFYDGRVGR